MSITGAIRPPEWMEQGICAQADPDAWFPEGGASTADAKAICATCPVLDLCLAYAIDHTELEGIWGGTTHRQRMTRRTAARLGNPCAWCGESFDHEGTTRRYCGDECKAIARQEQKRASDRRRAVAA
jgi:WhiB family transcriptional regulator, redox-sensing transcriptional regulator